MVFACSIVFCLHVAASSNSCLQIMIMPCHDFDLFLLSGLLSSFSSKCAFKTSDICDKSPDSANHEHIDQPLACLFRSWPSVRLAAGAENAPAIVARTSPRPKIHSPPIATGLWPPGAGTRSNTPSLHQLGTRLLEVRRPRVHVMAKPRGILDQKS